MMINGTMFNADLLDILVELQSQLHINGYQLLNTIKDGPQNVMISCPYHKDGQEKRPSAGIKKSDGTFHCLACGETHSLQEVIAHCFGYHDDFIGAFGWNWLIKNFLTVSVMDRKDIPLDYSRDRRSNRDTTYITADELDSYRYIHPYMYKRKMNDDAIQLFDIGYDASTKCITFPVRDTTGGALLVARRSVNSKFFNYPAESAKPVYGLYEYQLVGKPSEVIICESMIDAITCFVYGKFAVALNGLGTDLQFNQLNSMPCRKFILATDMDEAGLKARKRLRRYLKNKIISEYVWDISVAKDINDMTQEQFNSLKEVL